VIVMLATMPSDRSEDARQATTDNDRSRRGWRIGCLLVLAILGISVLVVHLFLVGVLSGPMPH
jgi:hypothetical protein